MAQPTVTARPAYISGTSGPILYKLTSTNYSQPGYRFEVEVWDVVAAAKIADAVYYADSAGLLMCDVSSFLKSSLENTCDLTGVTVVFDDVNAVSYYIKYRELWTASSETQVDDVANDRLAIYGGLQIGNENDFSESINDFLMLIDSPKAVTNYPFVFSFYGLTNWILRKERYLLGALQSTINTVLSSDGFKIGVHKETSTADRVDIKLIANNDNGGSSTKTVTRTNSTGGDINTFAWALLPGIVPVLTYTFTNSIAAVADALDSVGSYIYYIYADGEVELVFSSVRTGSAGTDTATGVTLPTPSKLVSQIRILSVNVYDATTANNISASITINGLADSEVSLIGTKTVEIIEECNNTVVLQWRNSLGGVECHPFEINQEYSWHYSNRKAKRLTLYADNLSLNQWEAIQGLNTLGELYKTPITEMTTSLNRTMATVGQSVYVLNSDGTKIGVNVIGLPNTTQTKQKKHSATVVIEYPELLLQ